ALWILYTATPLARLEVIGAGLIADREVLPQAMRLNPKLFRLIYSDLLNSKKTAKNIQAALSAIDSFLAERAGSVFRLILDHMREVGEARSATEIDGHFKRNFNLEHISLICEYLADQGLLGKVSITRELTKR